MHSFRIIVKTPDHIVGHNDAAPQRSGWIEFEKDNWLVVVCDHASDTRMHYRVPTLIDAVQTFALKLAGL